MVLAMEGRGRREGGVSLVAAMTDWQEAYVLAIVVFILSAEPLAAAARVPLWWSL